MLRPVLLSATIILSAVTARAADTEWHWIWTTPDYVRTDNSPTWSSETGIAKVTFRGNSFSARLENARHDPAYDIAGRITGRRVTATAKPTDSDGSVRHCSGTAAPRKGMELIAVL